MRALMPMLLLAACAANPTEDAADNIEDAAEARADAIRTAADAQASQLTNSANAIMANVADEKSYEGQVARTRADALTKEAKLLGEKARAEAEAAKSAGEAEADALRAR